MACFYSVCKEDQCARQCHTDSDVPDSDVNWQTTNEWLEIMFGGSTVQLTACEQSDRVNYRLCVGCDLTCEVANVNHVYVRRGPT